MEFIVINSARVFPSRKGARIVKRIADVLLCLLSLPLTLPLMGICALAIRIDSLGPALFIQERIGKDGRRFRMYKFRTMRDGLDDTFHRAFMKAFVKGQIIGKEDDPRRAFARAFASEQIGDKGDCGGCEMVLGGRKNGNIYKPFRASQVTRVGRFLRKTSLDELPQIFNVLKGEMSLVGPRPNVPWEVEEYQLWHYERLEVLPGITGLAQVKGRSGISFDTIVKYDIEYVKNQSLLLDLKILSKTVLAVIKSKGAL